MSGFDSDPAEVRRMENMSELMNRIGLDPIGAARICDGAVLGSAVRICEACQAGDVCHDWLLRAARTLYTAPAFCPNADRFAQLLADQPIRLRNDAAA